MSDFVELYTFERPPQSFSISVKVYRYANAVGKVPRPGLHPGLIKNRCLGQLFRKSAEPTDVSRSWHTDLTGRWDAILILPAWLR